MFYLFLRPVFCIQHEHRALGKSVLLFLIISWASIQFHRKIGLAMRLAALLRPSLHANLFSQPSSRCYTYAD